MYQICFTIFRVSGQISFTLSPSPIFQGVGGAVQYPKNYLKRAFDKVRGKGGLCIADEVSANTGTILSFIE